MTSVWRDDYDGPLVFPSAPGNVGDRVVIQGLHSKPELNGCSAHIITGSTRTSLSVANVGAHLLVAAISFAVLHVYVNIVLGFVITLGALLGYVYVVFRQGVSFDGVERIQIRAAGGHVIRVQADNLRLETPEEWTATVDGRRRVQSSVDGRRQWFGSAWSPAEFAYILRVYSGHVKPQIVHEMLLKVITMSLRPELLPNFTCINHSDAVANQLEFLAADGAAGVVRALRSNAADEKVAEVGMNVLTSLCMGGEPRLRAVRACATVRDAGAAAAAVLVLWAQPTAVGRVTADQDAPKMGVVQNACRFLSNLVRGDDLAAPTALTPFQMAVYDAGGLQALLKALSHNPTSPEVMRDALKALGGLVWAAGARLTGSQSLDSVVDAALSGMRTCLQSAAVQINGCNALNNSLDEFPVSKWSRSSALLAKAAVAAMNAHKNDTDALTEGCVLLYKLASNGFVQAVRDASAERVVSRTLRKYCSSTQGVGKALHGLAAAITSRISDEAEGTASITEVFDALAEADYGNDGGADRNREVPRCARCRSISAADQGERLKQCAGCMQVWYCGTLCQRAHWKSHTVACLQHQSEAALRV